MNNFVKVTLAAAILGGAIWLYNQGRSTVAEWASKVTVRITAFGIPQYMQNVLALPITITITNPTPLAVPISSMRAGLFVLKGSNWEMFGTMDPVPAFEIQPGENPLNINPRIDVQKLNPFSSSQTIQQYVSTAIKPVTIKLAVALNIQGYDFEQVETRSLTIKDLLRNVA